MKVNLINMASFEPLRTFFSFTYLEPSGGIFLSLVWMGAGLLPAFQGPVYFFYAIFEPFDVCLQPNGLAAPVRFKPYQVGQNFPPFFGAKTYARTGLSFDETCQDIPWGKWRPIRHRMICPGPGRDGEIRGAGQRAACAATRQ